MTSIRESHNELVGLGRRLREAIPDVYAGYAQLHHAAMGDDGALPGPVKELIALAIAVTRECDGCILAHARAAAQRGATAQEVAETMGVAILMNGGPGTVYGPPAFEEFAAHRGGPDGPGGPGGPDGAGGPDGPAVSRPGS